MVLACWLSWQRARVHYSLPELTDEERSLAALQVEELAMRLHVLTGGWFDREPAAAGAPASTPRTPGGDPLVPPVRRRVRALAPDVRIVF